MLVLRRIYVGSTCCLRSFSGWTAFADSPRKAKGLLPHGMIRCMDRSGVLQINLAAVRAAVELALLGCDELSRAARRLRVPVQPPSTDPISLHLAACATSARLHLGLAGEHAAEELSRMMEFLTAGAYRLAAISARTQVSILGLEVTPIAPDTSVRASRTAEDVEQPGDLEPLTGDAEVLSFAVLLGEGHDDWNPPPAQTAGLRTAAVNVARAGEMLAAGLSYGERPAATLTRFGDWICTYADTVDAAEAAVGEWAAVYRTVRPAAQTAGGPYLAFLAGAVAGQPGSLPDSGPARAVLTHYLDVSIPGGDIADFPRLNV